MASYPNVSPGDKFQPSAGLSNDVRRLLNAMNGFGSGTISARSSGLTQIQVYNNTSNPIDAGTAVNFSEDAVLCEDAVPAKILTSTSKPWGIVPVKLAPKQIGACVIGGPVTVSISGTPLQYVIPDTTTPGKWNYSNSGSTRVLYANSSKAIVLLGSTASSESGSHPFKCSVKKDSEGNPTSNITLLGETTGGVANIITIGSTNIIVPEQDISISASVIIYVKITWNGSAYTTAVFTATSAALPANSNTQVIIPVSYVEYGQTSAPGVEPVVSGIKGITQYLKETYIVSDRML